MISLKPCNFHYSSSFLSNHSKLQILKQTQHSKFVPMCNSVLRSKHGVRACSGIEGENKVPERRTFLSLEEAGLVEISGLSTHERFLCRLTISSLNLLRVISEEEACSMEELNAGRVCDWFVKDKLKREQNLDSAVLQWDDSELQF